MQQKNRKKAEVFLDKVVHVIIYSYVQYLYIIVW
jgi:hypothetical protein